MTTDKKEPAIPLKWFYKTPVGIIFTIGGIVAIVGGTVQAISTSWNPRMETRSVVVTSLPLVNQTNIENIKEDVRELKEGQKVLDRKYDEQMSLLRDIRRDIRRNNHR